MKHKIALLGNGWLGKAIHEKTNSLHLNTIVFSRNTARESNIHTYIVGDTIPIELSDCGTVIMMIPPSLRKLEAGDVYVKHENFIDQLPHEINIIYCSSTSVYKGDGLLNEEDECEGTIFDIENLIRIKFKKHLILRLGGLAGPKRPIVNILQRSGVINNFDAPSNLLHLDDATNSIILGLQNGIHGTFNVCSPEHPTKFEVYNKWNDILQLPHLLKGERALNNKTISCKSWLKRSKIIFKYPNPIDFKL